MADVAKEANVNRITVSRALSRPELVAEETLKRIRDAIARTGYIPDQIARGMKAQHSRIVSLVTPPQMSGVYGSVLESLSERLGSAGLLVNLYPLQDDADHQDRILKEIVGWRPAVIVLVGAQLTESDVRTLDRAQIPIVQLLAYSQESPGICVGYDQYEAAFKLTTHLLDRGYRKICYVHSGRVVGSINRARLDGFVAAIESRHGQVQLRRSDADGGRDNPANAKAATTKATGIELKSPPTFQAGYDLMGLLAAWDVRPEAILFGSDMVAVGALQYCLAHGVRPREDVALCAFDGIALTTVIHPSLTSLDLPYERVIAEGARQILNSVGKGTKAGRHIRIPCRVVPRSTT
jgi:LacI family gluconate utilization system Gnt-I transcriptional repressor